MFRAIPAIDHGQRISQPLYGKAFGYNLSGPQRLHRGHIQRGQEINRTTSRAGGCLLGFVYIFDGDDGLTLGASCHFLIYFLAGTVSGRRFFLCTFFFDQIKTYGTQSLFFC